MQVGYRFCLLSQDKITTSWTLSGLDLGVRPKWEYYLQPYLVKHTTQERTRGRPGPGPLSLPLSRSLSCQRQLSEPHHAYFQSALGHGLLCPKECGSMKGQTLIGWYSHPNSTLKMYIGIDSGVESASVELLHNVQSKNPHRPVSTYIWFLWDLDMLKVETKHG